MFTKISVDYRSTLKKGWYNDNKSELFAVLNWLSIERKKNKRRKSYNFQ